MYLVVCLYKAWQYVNVQVRALIRKVLQFITKRSMTAFRDCAYDIMAPAHVELNAFAKRPVQKFFAPIRLHPDRPPMYRFRVFWIFKNRLKRCRDSWPSLLFHRHM
jgi:hypothetical protein